MQVVETERGRPVSRPLPLLDRLREVGWKCRCWWDFGVQAPLHHVSDAAKIEADIIPGDPRVRDALGTCQFDYGRHGGRHLAVVHLIPFEMLRPDVRLDEMTKMNHSSCADCPNPASFRDGGEAQASPPARPHGGCSPAKCCEHFGRSGWSSYGFH